MKIIKSMVLAIFLLATTCITQAGLGGMTLAPQQFTVAQPFNKPGLIGNYFIDTKIATIQDPTGKNPTVYKFKNILTYNQSIKPPVQLSYIGSFQAPLKSNPMAGISQTNFLYGTLIK